MSRKGFRALKDFRVPIRPPLRVPLRAPLRVPIKGLGFFGSQAPLSRPLQPCCRHGLRLCLFLFRVAGFRVQGSRVQGSGLLLFVLLMVQL